MFSLSKDNSAWTRGVGLGKDSYGSCYCGDILAIGKSGCRSPGLCLGLIANDNVTVGENLLQINTEKLRDERRREIENKSLGQDEHDINLKGSRHTFPAADAFKPSSTTDCVPCVRKKPPR